MKNKDHHNSPLNNGKLKQLPFKIKDDYFQSLTDNIMNAAEAESGDLKYNLHLKKNPLTVPDGYFADLSEKIIENVGIVEQKVVPLYQRSWVQFTAVAACIALFLTVYLNTEKDTTSDWNDISSQTIISFLEEENALDADLLINIEEIDSILDDIYTTETSSFASALDENPELEYDFEYFDY
ncbi:hypothetical protein [Roseivirga misakiensis]|uniref:Uncharacterized protein n=1 Tax=Roseivirga misakiensis TaxID=1563681 RepID=A0A1E5T1S1_9BACT|nr:hypothetical protein [Roseivirga misakiensis]OEK05247.1 hypothetical protein BFP71_17750 [Roseivirga misakiensis]